MRAVTYDAYGETPTIRERPQPECPTGAAVVRVRATGVCRSDWHAWRGHDPVPLPMVPGHEFAGVVERVGAGVTGARPGDRVTAPFVCGCGHCPWCAAGDAQVCPDQYQPGFTGPGSFAELVLIPAADTNLIHLPDALGFDAAAALGCRFATAWRAVTDQGRLTAGDTLAVFGCGGLGLSAVMIGRALDARVFAIDVSSAALARAAALGAEPLEASDLDAAIAAIQRSGGAHVSLDALGSPALAAASVRSLRRRGRHIQVGLLLGDDAATPLPMDVVVAHELEILGSHGMAAADYPAMLALVAAGRLDPAALIGRRISLEDAPAALAALDRPGPPGLTVVELG